MTSKRIALSDGSELWIKDRKLHREDGPAVYNAREKQSYFFLDGKKYAFSKWIKKTKISPKELTVLCLKYGDNNVL